MKKKCIFCEFKARNADEITKHYEAVHLNTKDNETGRGFRELRQEPREPRQTYREDRYEYRESRQPHSEDLQVHRECQHKNRERRQQRGGSVDILKPCKFGPRCDRGWGCRFLHLASDFHPLQGSRRN